MLSLLRALGDPLSTRLLWDGSEPGGPAAPPADPPSDPPADPPAEDPPADEWTPPDRQTWDGIQKEMRKQRQELAQYKKSQQQTRESAGEYETLYAEEKRKREDLEQRIQATERQGKALQAASRHSFRRPDAAIRLLPDDAFETDKALDDALKALAREMPELVAPARGERAQGSATGDNGGAGPGSMNTLLRQATGRSA